MSFERAKLKKKGQNLAGGETPDADVSITLFIANQLLG